MSIVHASSQAKVFDIYQILSKCIYFIYINIYIYIYNPSIVYITGVMYYSVGHTL